MGAEGQVQRCIIRSHTSWLMTTMPNVAPSGECMKWKSVLIIHTYITNILERSMNLSIFSNKFQQLLDDKYLALNLHIKAAGE